MPHSKKMKIESESQSPLLPEQSGNESTYSTDHSKISEPKQFSGAQNPNSEVPETPKSESDSSSLSNWTFLSNHAHVLLLISGDPAIRLRDVASKVGITERAVQRIIADLEAGNYIQRRKVGRRNQYHVNRDLPLRHPIEAHRTIRCLIDLILDTTPS